MVIVEEKPKPIIFAEALDEGVNSAFTSLRDEIMKQGALSSKEKAIVGLGMCSGHSLRYMCRVS